MTKQLKKKDLEALLLGGTFFGSGGGGTRESAEHFVRHFNDKKGFYNKAKIEVVSLDEIDNKDEDQHQTVVLSYVGSPEAVNAAKYPTGPIMAVRNVMERLESQGKKLSYIAPPESGAMGFILVCLVAAKLGLKVIDGDGAGRAVPSLPNLTYAAVGIDPKPAFLVSQQGLAIELNVSPRKKTGDKTHQQDVSALIEQMMRPIISNPDFNELGGLAIWVMSPSDLKKAVTIKGTLTRALQLGEKLKQGEIKTASSMINYLNKQLKISAYAISKPGKLISVNEDTSGGFDLGKVIITNDQKNYTVLYQNESLIVWDDKTAQPMAMAPDSIAYFVEHSETNCKSENVFSNGDLTCLDNSLNKHASKGKISIIAWNAEKDICQPKSLPLNSFMQILQNLGYYGPYISVDKLQK